jgi:hypothetical protein
MIDEDELILFKVLADRAAVTVPSYVIPKLANAVHQLLAEVERLKAALPLVEAAALRDAAGDTKTLFDGCACEKCVRGWLCERADKIESAGAEREPEVDHG